jgi:predicted ATPase/DNA-binding SARP family transcriptional activator
VRAVEIEAGSDVGELVEFGILGSLEVRVGESVIRLTAPRPRALLCLLILQAGRPVGVDDLIAGLWDDAPPRSAVETLRTYLSGLRRALPGDTVRTESTGYLLAVDPSAVDANRFEAAVTLARQARGSGDLDTAIEVLRQALAAWRGPALMDGGSGLIVRAAAERLEELRRSAIEEQTDGRLELGRHADFVADIEASVAAEPLRERRWAQLITALYRSGRQADALAAYRRVAGLLDEQLGIGPSAELSALHQAVLKQDPVLDAPVVRPAAGTDRLTDGGTGWPERPPARSPTAHLHSLPSASTSFVGRAEELRELHRLLGDARLVTCAGPGGVGKTRLAMKAASELVDGSDRGVWLVELAGVTDPELVPTAVAEAVGVRDEPGRTVVDSLVATLRAKELLIVLDNCEHLIAACAQLAETLVRTCPDLRLLATSREPLGVDGELVFRVPSLSLPATGTRVTAADCRDHEAVALFADRAAPHLAQRALDDTAAAAMVSICRSIDGIPLAIELAAARLRSMSLADVERRISDRFRLLTNGNRTARPRQQTLRALVDWSYDLLSAEEKTALGRVAVFAGGFDLDAAEALSARYGNEGFDVVDVIASLIDKSLVHVNLSGTAARYHLSETVRQYALERLEAANLAPEARRAHAEVFLALAQQADRELTGVEQDRRMQQLTLDRDNLRAAFAQFQRTDLGESALLLAASLGRFWWVSAAYREGVETLSAAINDPAAQARTPLRAAALTSYARLQRHWGDYASARRCAEEALTIAQALNVPATVAAALTVIVVLDTTVGRFEDAIAAGEQAVAIARELPNPTVLAEALSARGLACSYTDDVVSGPRDLAEALRICRATGNRREISTILNNLACFELDVGELERADRYARAAYELAVELDATNNLPYVLGTLATLSLLRGDPAAAHDFANQILALLTRTGDRRTSANAVLLLALSTSGLGDVARAAVLHGVADSCLIADAGYDPIEDGLAQRDRDRLREVLGPNNFSAAYTEGRQLAVGDDGLARLDALAPRL